MPWQLAYDRKPESGASADTREGVPQVMKSEAGQIGPFGNQRPWPLKIRAGFFIVGTRDDELPNARQGFQHGKRG
jgi:hypothetical protein